jgi:anti-sigma factor RsiW
MRGKISDQDLTDYALNELQPEERLYVESMLAVSEECRHDVYQMIELSQLLEEGFEKEEHRHQPSLTHGQREDLLRVRANTYPFWQKSAAVLVGAASLAFTLVHTELGTIEEPARQMAEASKHAALVVADAVGSSDMVEIKNAFQSLRAMAGDSSELGDVITPSPMICTPPTLFETAQLTGRGDMAQ